MNKLVLGALVLVLGLAGESFGRSPMRIDVRLKLERVPFQQISGGARTTLTVVGNGRVLEQVCREGRKGCKTDLVAILDRNEMEVIETLIDDARHGEIVVNSPRFHCLAINLGVDTYTADNGKILLSSAAVPCPTRTSRNVSPAAGKLVEKLRHLRSLANQQPNIALGN